MSNIQELESILFMPSNVIPNRRSTTRRATVIYVTNILYSKEVQTVYVPTGLEPA